ncbi:hypothetical protein IS481_11375 [Caldimonas thermodepolymerans]|mgnify:CR=1 FL=1|jgi:hypothetical protein|uniref:Uncharacterized protein n=1 Tax=Caldimonas thermodepolymerans TaxID=215580 RepID=A0A2S5T1E2_9BURK|nr:hypothetical protein [Caldimonas thermodepolymerans]PPE68762.1 hypothetical protein C1702_15575 [Caldimonas thermodepolymerans]QPC30380.1 hypothetical protein IS481_11375 [Caldimonas thermodepolymerans]RDH95642.1 hypothetical protein DES46_11352 [Caldimonas thermodepolymerans]UZG43144.1 hypothetical protein ONZ46_12075 [Caldimonas thermodepolymerans]
MKEYKLSGWPELPASYQRTAYQRMLHQMSQGFVPLGQLLRVSGLGRDAVRRFLAYLQASGVLVEREHAQTPRTLLVMDWIRRTLGGTGPRRQA